jgi:hypothetical protein
MIHIFVGRDVRTCSSSTLAASGRASEARTIIVERTMGDGEEAGVTCKCYV